MAATIKSQVNQFTSNTISRASDIGSKVTSMINGITGQVSATINSLIPGSVVGINIQAIPEMKEVVNKMITDINTHLEDVYVNTDPSGAFADPGMQDACKAYVKGVMEACKNYVSQLGKFVDLLTEIQENYVTQQAAQASTVESAGAEVANSVDAYTTQG